MAIMPRCSKRMVGRNAVPNMMHKVQTRVTETYGSVEAFVEHHRK